MKSVVIGAHLEREDVEPIADALPPSRAEIVKLYGSREVTVLKVVWAPGMSFGPHDHRMWAAIGVYSGGEQNQFYRRVGDTLAPSGGARMRRAFSSEDSSPRSSIRPAG